MNEANAIVEMISTMGFPIVMCCVMCYYVKYLNDTHKKEIDELNESHKAEVSDMKDTINNNTIVMEKLSTKIDLIIGLDKEGEEDGQ